MSNKLDLVGAKKYKPGLYETFDNNLADILLDALQGDQKVLELPEIQALGVKNIQAALEWLNTADVNGDYKNLLRNEGWRLMYKRKPPTPEEYLTYDWIGGQSEGLWQNVREAFINFIDPNPLNPARGLALSTSIGWGKSQPISSNIVVGKTIKITLEDDTVLEFQSDQKIKIKLDGVEKEILANELLKIDVSKVDFTPTDD